jgi:hypothetical protein
MFSPAREKADMMKNYPYTVMYVSMGIDVLGVLVLPESKNGRLTCRTILSC